VTATNTRGPTDTATVTLTSTTTPHPTEMPTITPNQETHVAATFNARLTGTANAVAAFTKTPTLTATPTVDIEETLAVIVAATDAARALTATANAIASFTKTPTPTHTSTPSPTLTPTRTLTNTPTSTPTPISTRTLFPTQTPTQQGPSGKTATARGVEANKSGANVTLLGTATALAIGATKTYFDDSGVLVGKVDNIVSIQCAAVKTKNFVVNVRFYNPYKRSIRSWDYAIHFRSQGGNNQYRVTLTSWKQWILEFVSGSFKRIKYGDVPGMDLNENGFNDLSIVVKDNVGVLIVNGRYISSLPLSIQLTPGDICIVSEGLSQDEANGAKTYFDNFTIWVLP
jgi:hypothetical protein